MRNVVQQDLSLHIKTVLRAIRLPIHFDNQLQGICIQEKKNFTTILIDLIQKGLKQSINEQQTFFCQCCGLERSIKKQHLIPVGLELFMFDDDCFFSQKWKQFIRQIL